MTAFNEAPEYTIYDEDGGNGDGLPRIQWRQGDARQGTPGYFFISASNASDGFTPGSNWTPHLEYFKSTRTRDQGWKCEALRMQIICARAQPYRKTADGGVAEWCDVWPKGATGMGEHADLLLVAEGLEELGPVVLSTNSTTTAFGIVSGPNPKHAPHGGVLYRQREEVLKAADALSNKGRHKARAYWSFWATLGGERDAKGNAVYTPMTAGTEITRLVLLLPEKIDKAWLVAQYVGGERDTQGRDLRAEYEPWRATRRTNDAQQVAPLPAPRNVPQEVDEEALF